jgi:hypothetical protein
MVETITKQYDYPARLQMNYWTSVRMYERQMDSTHLQTKGVNYDYGMLIRFNQIYISPEQINQTEFVKNVKLKMAQRNC